jgi:Holliday junction resolvase
MNEEKVRKKPDIQYRTEADIQKKLIKNLEKKGWMVVKLIQTTTNGIPDLLLMRDKKVVFIEVKHRGARSTPLQEYVQNKIRECGIDVFETNNPDFLI